MYYIVYYLPVIPVRKACFPCIQPKKAKLKIPVCCSVCIYNAWGASGPRPPRKREQSVNILTDFRQENKNKYYIYIVQTFIQLSL